MDKKRKTRTVIRAGRSSKQAGAKPNGVKVKAALKVGVFVRPGG